MGDTSFTIKLSAAGNANLDLITNHAARPNPSPANENNVTHAFGDGNMPKMNHVLFLLNVWTSLLFSLNRI